MSFIFKCPYCQQSMSCEDDWDGLEAQCPNCDKDVTLRKKAIPILAPEPQPEQQVIPQLQDNSTPPMPSEPTADVPDEPDFLFICPECGSPVILPASKHGKPHTCQFCGEDVIALPSTTRKCPSCGETIKILATICKKCHKPVPPIIPKNTTSQNTRVVNGGTGIKKQTDIEQPTPTPPYIKPFVIILGILYILGVVLLCFENTFQGFILIPIILNFIYFFLPKGGLKFHLLEGERLLYTCHVERAHEEGEKADGDGAYFVRMTNKRIVFSAIDYVILPYMIAYFVEKISRPSSLDIELLKEEIEKIHDEKGKLFGYPMCIIYANGTKYIFKRPYSSGGVDVILNWWNES